MFFRQSFIKYIIGLFVIISSRICFPEMLIVSTKVTKHTTHENSFIYEDILNIYSFFPKCSLHLAPHLSYTFQVHLTNAICFKQSTMKSYLPFSSSLKTGILVSRGENKTSILIHTEKQRKTIQYHYNQRKTISNRSTESLD